MPWNILPASAIIPMTWNNLTVKQYQDIFEVLQYTEDKFEQICSIVAIANGLTYEDVNQMHPLLFSALCKDAEFMFDKVSGKPRRYIGVYKINYNIPKWKWRQFVEIQYWLHNGFEYNIHNILASASNLPLLKNTSNNHPAMAERFKGYNCRDCYSSAAEVVKKLTEFNAGFQEPTTEQEEEAEKIEEDYGDTGFQDRWGWIYSTKLIADHRGIPLEKAYELTAIQAMNDLAYIKALQKEQEKLMIDASKQK